MQIGPVQVGTIWPRPVSSSQNGLSEIGFCQIGASQNRFSSWPLRLAPAKQLQIGSVIGTSKTAGEIRGSQISRHQSRPLGSPLKWPSRFAAADRSSKFGRQFAPPDWPRQIAVKFAAAKRAPAKLAATRSTSKLAPSKSAPHSPSPVSPRQFAHNQVRPG